MHRGLALARLLLRAAAPCDAALDGRDRVEEPLALLADAGESAKDFVARFTRTDGLARMSNAWGY